MSSSTVLGLGVGAVVAFALAACTVDVGDEVAQDSQDMKAKQFCGGFANLPCPEGYVCVDDPKDNCDPNNGGADCGGICVRDKTKDCERGSNFEYVAHDPDTCAVIKFMCFEGTPFFNDCGCGCELPVGEPCNQVVCAAGEYCCNESCSICAPEGGACIQVVCA